MNVNPVEFAKLIFEIDKEAAQFCFWLPGTNNIIELHQLATSFACTAVFPVNHAKRDVRLFHLPQGCVQIHTFVIF